MGMDTCQSPQHLQGLVIDCCTAGITSRILLFQFNHIQPSTTNSNALFDKKNLHNFSTRKI